MRRFAWSIGGCVALAIFGYVLLEAAIRPAVADHHETAEPESVTVAKKMVEVFNNSDWEAAAELMAEDHVYVEHGTQRTIEGRDAVIEAIKAWKMSMPDVIAENPRYYVDGNSVAIELVWHGTHTGPLMTPNGAIEASGKEQKTPGVWIVDVGEGRVTASRNYFDMMTFLQQIGAMPSGE